MTALLLALTVCFGANVDRAYLHRDTGALQALYDSAATTYDSMLVLYRLYPLTQDKNLLQDLPEELESASASELAILSALWAFRIHGAGPFKLISYGRRSVGFLDRAIDIDPNDPFVLLSEGQSLFYRPEWAGGSKRAALERFNRLRENVVNGTCGVSVDEADMWRWLTLDALGHDAADDIKRSILDGNPPPLVIEFVTGPTS